MQQISVGGTLVETPTRVPLQLKLSPPKTELSVYPQLYSLSCPL